MSFTRLDPSDFVVSADSVTAPAWSNNAPTLTAFYSASSTVTGSYYVDVYNTKHVKSINLSFLEIGEIFVFILSI